MRILYIAVAFILTGTSQWAQPTLDDLLRPVDPPEEKAEATDTTAAEAPTAIQLEPSLPFRLDESTLLAELIHELAGEIDWEGELRLNPIRPLPRLTVLPDWEIRFKGTLPPLIENRMTLTFEVWTDGRQLGSWRQPFRTELWQEVWVARQRIRRGNIIDTQAIEPALRDVLTERNQPLSIEEDIKGLETVSTIMEGRVLSWSDLQKKPAVRRGERVEVFIKNGALSISMPAHSTEEGHVGDLITVRNIQSKRNIQAVVTSEGRAEVVID